MSKSTLQAFKSEIDRDCKSINSCEAKIEKFDKEILSIIDDEVGRNMKESIESINRHFSNNMSSGYYNANAIVSPMNNAYDDFKNCIDKAKIINRRAKDLFEELERYERSC